MKDKSKMIMGAGIVLVAFFLMFSMLGIVVPTSTIVYEDLEDGVMPVFELPENRATIDIDTTGKIEGQNSLVYENIPGGAGTPIFNYKYPSGLIVDEWEISILIDESNEENIKVSLFQNVEYTHSGQTHNTWGFTIGATFFSSKQIKLSCGDFSKFNMNWEPNKVYTMKITNIDYNNESADITISSDTTSETKTNILFQTREKGIFNTTHRIDGFGIHGSSWHKFKKYFDKWTLGYQDQIVEQPESGTEPIPLKPQADNTIMFIAVGVIALCFIFYYVNRKENK
jgi:hypothetical protein